MLPPKFDDPGLLPFRNNVCQYFALRRNVCAQHRGANTSALQVCTPGAQFPPNASLPSMIIIGDSVSEGYQPVVSANLSSQIFVQHSPWSVGGGADDINNGLNCEEEFLRTAMYEPGGICLLC